MYRRLLKPFFFLFEPECAHRFVIFFLKFILKIPGSRQVFKRRYSVNAHRLKRNLFGLEFSNPVGLAAGFDKNADLIDELACLGFGFVEIGTVTPKPQPGNPKPRVFRLPRDEALVNRLGFNNEGLEAAVSRLKKRKPGIIVGANIGKNRSTPNDKAADDYGQCFEALFDYVDYFAVNVSSPNTPGLRELQEKEPLTALLAYLQELNFAKKEPKPILLKIAPDLTDGQLDEIIAIVLETRLAGVIATNTTVQRDSLRTPKSRVDSIGEGGLSGKPLAKRSTEVIKYLAEKSGKTFPIIGVGGVHSPEDAIGKLNAGADLVQVYTGLIYRGPSLVKSINKALLPV